MKKFNLFLVLIFVLNIVCFPVPTFAGSVNGILSFQNGIVSANNISYNTNADVTVNGLMLVAATPLVNQNVYPPYLPAKTKAELNVDVISHSKEAYQNLAIEVSYRDIGLGWFALTYMTEQGDLKKTIPVCTENTGTDKIHIFNLYDASLDNSVNSGYDFCITTYKSSEMYEYSQAPVYILNISVDAEPEYSPISVKAGTKNEGNIFFSGESIEFNILYTNLSNQSANVSVAYNIYIYDKEFNKGLVQTDSTEFIMQAGGSENTELAFEVQKYGQYCLEIILSGEAGTMSVSTETRQDFSKCMLNDTLNKTFGAAAHMYGGRGDPYVGFKLMSKAGMGLIREGPHWSSYEKASGTGSLSQLALESYDASYQYGIDRILTILCKNQYIDPSVAVNTRYSLPSLSVMDELSNYVQEYISLPAVRRSVKMVEVENEPELTKYIDGVSIVDTLYQYERIGERYAYIAKTVSDAVRAVAPDIKVGGFTVSGLQYNNVKTLVNSGLQKLIAINGHNALDAFTCHPYMYNEDPEPGSGGISGMPNTSVVNRVEYYKDLLNSYNFNISQRWFSEMGFSSATNVSSSSASLGSEYEVAKRLIRQYVCLKEVGFSDLYCTYDLINDNYISNMTECNFGLLKCWKDVDVPYAAKYGFLTVAALNKLTAGATGCESVYSNNYKYVSRFICPQRNVYMLWTSKTSGNQTIPFNFNDSVQFYDMMGNKMELSDVMTETGIYKVSDEPVFAVTGDPISDSIPTSVVEDGIVVKINGVIDSGDSGKMVTLTTLAPGALFDENMLSSIIHIDQTVTGENGEYSFEARVPKYDETFSAYIVSEDGGPPVKFTIDVNELSVSMALRNGIERLTKLDIDLVDISKIKAEVRLNSESNISNYTMFFAVYDNNKLVNVKKFEGRHQQYAETLVYDTSVNENISYDQIKLFLWNDTDEMTPLCRIVKYE